MTATIALPNGAPVPIGQVDFFDGHPGGGDTPLGSPEVRDGKASVTWRPDVAGQHNIHAGYYNGLPDYLPVANGIVVNVIPGFGLGQICPL